VIARKQADRVAEDVPADTSGERTQTPHEELLAEAAIAQTPPAQKQN
jgi:hypothetical protein